MHSNNTHILLTLICIGIFINKIEEVEPCSNNFECSSGICSEGNCKQKNNGISCRNNNECHSGICNGGYCKGCSPSLPCPPSQMCNFENGQCEVLHHECNSNFDCKDDSSRLLCSYMDFYKKKYCVPTCDISPHVSFQLICNSASKKSINKHILHQNTLRVMEIIDVVPGSTAKKLNTSKFFTAILFLIIMRNVILKVTPRTLI